MIRLAKLPERNPLRLGIVVTPTLHEALIAYAAVYAEEYGLEEPITELIPAMLTVFLESDRAFAKARSRKAARGN